MCAARSGEAAYDVAQRLLRIDAGAAGLGHQGQQSLADVGGRIARTHRWGRNNGRVGGGVGAGQAVEDLVGQEQRGQRGREAVEDGGALLLGGLDGLPDLVDGGRVRAIGSRAVVTSPRLPTSCT